MSQNNQPQVGEWIVRVIKMLVDWNSFCGRADEELNLHFYEAIDLPFMDLILDMLGVPEDESATGGYCRDFWFDLLVDLLRITSDADEIYKELLKELHSISEDLEDK